MEFFKTGIRSASEALLESIEEQLFSTISVNVDGVPSRYDSDVM